MRKFLNIMLACFMICCSAAVIPCAVKAESITCNDLFQEDPCLMIEDSLGQGMDCEFLIYTTIYDFSPGRYFSDPEGYLVELIEICTFIYEEVGAWQECPWDPNIDINDPGCREESTTSYPDDEWQECPWDPNIDINDPGCREESTTSYPNDEWQECPWDPNIDINDPGCREESTTSYPNDEWQECPWDPNGADY